MTARDTLTIDIHAHVVIPEAIELIRDEFDPASDPFLRFGGVSTAYNDGLASELFPMLTDPARRLERMDRQGVDLQVVSIAPPQYHYWAGPDLGAEVARIQNDAISALVERYPRSADRRGNPADAGPGPGPWQSSSGWSRVTGFEA